MIVVDTNLVSEVMRERPDGKVLLWYRSVPRRQLYTTTVTVAEILAGIGYLPEGRRQAAMQQDARLMFENDFNGRILPFDLASTESYARIAATRRAQGRPIKPLDGQIAAITITHDMSLATRNTKDFEGCGVDLINPWEA
jgi:predicted nucleic acid-binding protein